MTDSIDHEWAARYAEHLAGLKAHLSDSDNLARAYLDLRARNERLREAVGDLLDTVNRAEPGAFRNGVEDSTGTMDEGEYYAGVAIDRARQAYEEGGR